MSVIFTGARRADRRTCSGGMPFCLCGKARGCCCLAALSRPRSMPLKKVNPAAPSPLGSGDVIESASPPAQRLLAAWFGNGFGGRLPRAHRRLAQVDVARPTTAIREQRHAARRRGADARCADRRRGASTTAADGEEVEVLRGLAAGRSTAEIARELYVTPATVSKHLEHVYRKLGVQSRTAALAAIGARVDTLR